METTMAAIGAALVGGCLIGLSAVLLLAATGRIAGISGIVSALLPPHPADDPWWRVAFVAGLLAAPLLLGVLTGTTGIGTPAVGMPMLAGAGFLVGVGTVLGGGCTSGHGICGIARLSPRSFVAVAMFMGAAIITVFVVRHLI